MVAVEAAAHPQPWEIRIGAPVTVADDQPAGTVERVVVNPGTRQVTHLVVHRGLLHRHDIVIPVSHVVASDDAGVRLQLMGAELDSHAPFQAQDFVAPPPGWEVPGYTRRDVLFALPRPLAKLAQGFPRLAASAPAGSLASVPSVGLDGGTPIVCRDGRVGRLYLLLLNPSDGQVTHLIARSSRRPRYSPIIPADWVTEITPRHIVVDAELAQVARLPEYLPDDELTADIEQALWSDETLRVDMPSVRVDVESGVATLLGHTVNRLHKQRIEEMVGAVRGVREIRNLLIADDDLRQEVAQALAHDTRTRSARLRIDVFLGKVALYGHVADAEARAAAIAIAAAVPGVRGVNDGLTIADDAHRHARR